MNQATERISKKEKKNYLITDELPDKIKAGTILQQELIILAWSKRENIEVLKQIRDIRTQKVTAVSSQLFQECQVLNLPSELLTFWPQAKIFLYKVTQKQLKMYCIVL